jgi:hypothetical protein
MMDHFAENDLIKKEADELLAGKGLIDLLKQFGIPHITGSYSLDLMSWRDLDIYLEADNITESVFFELGEKIVSIFQPLKMSFRNERLAQTKGLPAGLYWGIYLGNERAGAWKIDIWAVGSEECKKLLGYCNAILGQLTEEKRRYILEIKSKCWQDPEYRRSYSSADIYRAVLEKGITTYEGFKSRI